VENGPNIAKFACRGAGETGAKQFGAPLADPYAVPNLNYEVRGLLRTCPGPAVNIPSSSARLYDHSA
jgi:hypothetical protein